MKFTSFQISYPWLYALGEDGFIYRRSVPDTEGRKPWLRFTGTTQCTERPPGKATFQGTASPEMLFAACGCPDGWHMEIRQTDIRVRTGESNALPVIYSCPNGVTPDDIRNTLADAVLKAFSSGTTGALTASRLAVMRQFIEENGL